MNGEGMGVYCHIFINLALKVNGQLHPSHFTPVTHSIGGWVGPTASLDILEERKISFPYKLIFLVVQPVMYNHCNQL
jgi:hypothetical protein